MAKGIIVVDIPENCGNCACCQYDGQYDRYCGVNGKDLMNIDWNSEKPDWCPIKPMPEKRNEHDACYDSDFYRAEGWNACIDEILKGDIPMP